MFIIIMYLHYNTQSQIEQPCYFITQMFVLGWLALASRAYSAEGITKHNIMKM